MLFHVVLYFTLLIQVSIDLVVIATKGCHPLIIEISISKCCILDADSLHILLHSLGEEGVGVLTCTATIFFSRICSERRASK